MKAQVSAISMVLILGIVISLVGSAYLWGVPIIEKRTVITQFSAVAKFMEDLDRRISDMASTCTTAGACEASLDLPVSGDISVDASGNTIYYTFVISQPLFSEEEIPFNTGNVEEVAAYGEKPGVITVKGETENYVSTVVFKLHYRELVNKEQGKSFLINLTGSGVGTNKVIMSFGGLEVKPGQADNGGDLVVSRIRIETV